MFLGICLFAFVSLFYLEFSLSASLSSLVTTGLRTRCPKHLQSLLGIYFLDSIRGVLLAYGILLLYYCPDPADDYVPGCEVLSMPSEYYCVY